MPKTELIIGKTAIFNHCDMGWIEVEIKEKTPLLNYHTGVLKKIYMKEVRSSQSAQIAAKLLSENKNVSVFFKPDELIRYIDEQPLN